jgi:hypothetical protein
MIDSIISVLDNREISILIWLGVLFLLLLFRKGFRKSLIAVLRSLTQKNIAITMLFMILYVCLSIYVLHRLNFWDLSNLSVTVIWFIGVALVLFMNIPDLMKDDLIKKVVWDSLKIAAIVEFIANIYVFDLWIELILVPLFTIIGARLGYLSGKYKSKKAKMIFNIMAAIIGIGFIIYALYNIILDFQGFASIANLRDFLLPIIFTVILLPYVLSVSLFFVYKDIFSYIDRLINDQSLVRYTKWKTVVEFNFQPRILYAWKRKICLLNIYDKDEITEEIDKLKAQ